MPRSIVRLIALAALVTALPALASATEPSRFTAHDLETAAVLYTGEQTATTDGDTVTERVTYHAPDGTLIFEREGSYWVDNLSAVSYRATDHRLGMEEMVRRTNGGLEIRFKKDAKHKEKSRIHSSEGMQLLSLSIPALVRNEWGRLAAGEQLKFDLIVPSRTGTVGFRLSRSGEQTVDGIPTAVFRMEPSGWLVRKIVDPMFFYMALDGAHRSVQFHGRGVVPTADGEPLPVRVRVRVQYGASE
jgi:hypothetical protein